MTTTTSPQRLWDFALVFYAQPKIAEICVHLQDTYKVNVCLLIGLRWMDESGKHLSDAQFAELQSHIHVWTQQVVEPLRLLRRLLKEPVVGYAQDETQAQIRTSIKQAELLAEKKLLLEIEAWSQQLTQTQDSPIKSNLEVYLSALAVGQNVIELLLRKF
ncbi:MAG TPA: TIGR02444 family protein [Cellvibrio sp.]|nr:TIGR02444 family protein [Cellvibrio sp.]